ncbi:MAG: hypothetical protein R2705_01305 [Ilumatobacteraceae bacterium]
MFPASIDFAPSVDIDGFNVPTTSPIVLSGSGASNGIVRGLAITGFSSRTSSASIEINGASNVKVYNNYIGVLPHGYLMSARTGIRVVGGAANTTIGGAAASERNWIGTANCLPITISGTGTSAVIRGNEISSHSSAVFGILVAGSSTGMIGGTGPADGN